MNILAIETSCDETSAAVITERKGRPTVLSNVVSSQINLHRQYGGVVPEVAARAHIESIIPVLEKSLEEAGLALNEVSHVAVTHGPGLIGSLIVGVETAKAIGLAKEIPVIPINHLEGHLYANFSEEANQIFPALALLVSGGHTMLVLMKKHLSYEIVGNTRDDAAGEAFDKAAKIMGLGYPGGPIISKLAETGDEKTYPFPTIDLTAGPYRDKDGFLRHPPPSLDFSFSGLKTALLTKVRKITGERELSEKEKKDLAASFQKAIIDSLSQNVIRAAEKYQPKAFTLSGGVAANRRLREELKQRIKESFPDVLFSVPPPQMCTDNAGMIGLLAYYKTKKSKRRVPVKDIVATPGLRL